MKRKGNIRFPWPHIPIDLLTVCILCFVYYSFLAGNGETAVKPQEITVGMYNTYSAEDGNLGRAEPDLKEVWEGGPGVSEFGACNITMHYWPWPEDLPDVEEGENPYAAWWKGYMEEAYELTNQNGETGLRVMVGPLYNYYVSHKGKTFNEFVEYLCRWEKDSKYMGTLAGWYLAEEPMGSAHNYDTETHNEMAEDIKAVEDSVGVAHHTMYVDVGMFGKFFSQSSLAAFTRPADVVLTAAYLWSTSAQQPVYEPNWNAIHSNLSRVREIVNADRRRRGLPRPEFHMILEARGHMGHGQPTNWEMRQQIHLTLSQSLRYSDPAADGVWFFWWTEIARNKGNETDDWNYGRRIAEAIQTQVARSTFAESPSARKDYDPDKTQFRFPEFGSFNPTNSGIPYDLAEPGNVSIQVLDENMALVKDFDMKHQVAGELQRFGGPYWRRGSARDGFYIFRLYLNSKLVDEVKVKVQWNIMLNSASHQSGVWSSNNVVDIEWEPPAKELEGLDGYSVLWNTSRFTTPDDEKDLGSEITSLRSDPLPDGDSNYFHIRSVDGNGDWSTPVHLGPFYIDTTEPGNARDLASDSHDTGEWSRDNKVNVHWNPAEDAASGVNGYSVLWDRTPGALPDEEVDISSDVTMLVSEPFADGEYYLHIRSVDNAGNWAYTAAHIGPFLIDTSLPENVTGLMSSSHVSGQWSNNDTVMISWKAAEDSISGIGGYSVTWDVFPDTIPDESVDIDGWMTTATSSPLQSGEHYFYIRVVDRAGNWVPDARYLGPFMIDTEPPPGIGGLISMSHKPDEWSSQTRVDVEWTPVTDEISGIGRYEWGVAENADRMSALPGVWNSVSNPPLSVSKLDEDVWNIHVRAVDNAGNRGESEHVTVKIDSKSPVLSNVRSPSHPDNGSWYIDLNATFEWTAEDKTSGISDYNWAWNTNPVAAPDEPGSADILSAPSLSLTASSPGVWYFHLRAVDNAGNWSETSHYRVQMDPLAPPAPQIVSDTHRSSEWTSRNDVRLSWDIAPGPSGIAGYSYLLDQDRSSVPEEIITDGATSIGYSDLSDGRWYFHCRATSGTGLWGATSHYEIRIDTEAPTIRIVYPESDVWYTEAIKSYWVKGDDEGSGLDPESFEFSRNGDQWSWFEPAREGGDDGKIGTTYEATDDTLQVRVRDRAGNLGFSDVVIIKVDRSASTPIIVSSTHPDQDRWYSTNDPDFAWDFSEEVSGADGYSWAIDHSEDTIPPEIKMIEGSKPFKTDTEKLTDGIWYFHVRAKDVAGNWSETSSYKVKIDSIPPTARLEISGPAVIDGNPSTTRAGPVEVLLQTSETVLEPTLEYIPASAASSVPIKLTSIQPEQVNTLFSGNGWKGAFDVTIHTGDGDASFRFSARDQAGNVGSEITAGKVFVIDTLIRANADKTVEVLCVTEPKTRIALPPGAIDQDLRIEVVKRDSHLFPGMIAVYDFVPYNSRMRKLRDVVFSTPVSISFFPESLVSTDADDPGIGVNLWDGVEWQRVQDGWTSMRVDHLGSFALVKSEPINSNIMYGWAAPNPFTPNGSGDATDRTIFHVATRQGNSEGFEVKIYDINGRSIRHLEGGRRVWDGADEDGHIVEGGLYIYQIHSGDQVISGTVVVLR
ncbi:hypothetical protein ACFL6S_29975 [Candidatus Poribacteria bacterium]